MNPGRPAAQPDLHTLLMGGTHVYAGHTKVYDGYSNLVPANQEEPDIAKLMKYVQDREQFASLVERIVAHANSEMVTENESRFQDSQFIPFTDDDISAALDSLYATYKGNVERYCDMRSDLYLAYQQANPEASVSRGAALRMSALQMAFSSNNQD